MKVYHIKRSQVLPITLQQAWGFFSSPHNLVKITPTHMNFVIRHITGGEKMFAGQIICYKINVLPYWPVQWVTEITQVQEPHYFVDEQRFGPYALWHHCHWFRETENGTEITDEVSYAIPYGLLGRFVHRIFVERALNTIFDHRFHTLE